METHIVHLWKDAMNRNGSAGNLLCLRRRLEWRDIAVTVREVAVGEAVELSDCDLLYLGAGAPYENPSLLSALAEAAPALRAYVEDGGAFLAVCEGMELMGKSVTLPGGQVIPGAGAADFTTVYKDRRAGNLVFSRGGARMAAFENHAGSIALGHAVQPLGEVRVGSGNGEGNGVGLRYRNFYGCPAYSLLPLNPELADEILLSALERRYGGLELAALDDHLEDMARQRLLRRVDKEA